MVEHSYVKFVILAAPIYEISCGKTDRQTNKHINAAEQSTHSTVVGVAKETKGERNACVHAEATSGISTEAIDKRHAHCLDMSCRNLDHVLYWSIYRLPKSPRGSSVQRTIAITSCNQFPPRRSRPQSDYRSRTGVSLVRVHRTRRRRRRRRLVRPPARDCFPVDLHGDPSVGARTN